MITTPRAAISMTSVPTTTTAAAAAAGTTTTTSGTSAADLAGPGGPLGKDAFLKMLVAQLQNQDPMSPMQGDQMAAQLAQFSTVEQLTNINNTLTAQNTAQGSVLGALQASAAMATIGHTVVAGGNQLALDGSGKADVTVDVSAAGGAATVHVFDDSGKEVGSETLGTTTGGTHTFDISGATQNLPAGHYTYSVDVVDAAGATVTVQPYMTGKVDGVLSTSSGIVLTAGSLTIPYNSVTHVIG